MKKRIIIKRIILFLLIIINIFAFTSCKKDNSIKFNFASYGTAEKVPYNVFYEDDYFKNPASNYNPKLASASACLALAGFADISEDDFSNQDINAKTFFKNLGFSNYKANTYGITKPTANSFGVYIASKKIDDFTLIGITVRGAGYLSEWASNFTIGHNEDFAQGFFEASDIYLNFLKEYINDYNIKGNIKIWTSGYSRGGAVVNISAGRIDDGLVKYKNILSDEINYTKDDIYAYAFEAPAGKIIKNNDEEIFEKGSYYSNIFNIINLNDPVPFVAPRSFLFIRYGNDLFLPDIITDLNYLNHINIVKNKMKKLPNYKVVGDYKIDNFKEESSLSFMNKNSNYINFTPYISLNNLIYMLCQIIDEKDYYVDNVQDIITELFRLLYSSSTPKESLINLIINFGKSLLQNDINEVILFDIQNNPKQFTHDLEPLLYQALSKLDINITLSDTKTLIKQLSKLIYYIIFAEDSFQTIKSILNLENIKIIGSAHIPELLLCHITSLDSNYENSNLEVKSSFDILNIFTSSEFELTINNEKYVYFENGNINSKFVLKKKIDGGYLIYLPSNTNFKITSSGSLSYDQYYHNNKFVHDILIDSKTL